MYSTRAAIKISNFSSDDLFFCLFKSHCFFYNVDYDYMYVSSASLHPQKWDKVLENVTNYNEGKGKVTH